MSNQAQAQFDDRPTYIEISVPTLRANFREVRRRVAPAKVMASIKANGYGHGLITVARILESEGIDGLGVAYVEEAIELRQAGVSTPILVFGGLLAQQVDKYIQYELDVTAPSVMKLQQINESAKRLGKRARVHLKIDTGLERLGVHHYSSQSLFDAALEASWCDVVGVFSHFAEVSPKDLSLARLQLSRFEESVRYYEQQATRPFLKHIANSAAVLSFPESYLDMVRPGLCLYGVYPEPSVSGQWGLEPVLSLKSQVVYFKVVKQGAGVSYGHAWHAPCDTRVITIPIGYGDGYPRSLSNHGFALTRGRKCPIVGKVCMDQLMVNISPTGEAYNGDEVVLIGSQGGERISVEELAAIIDTTPHEILVMLNKRIPRRVVGE
jgi:alanine racemase